MLLPEYLSSEGAKTASALAAEIGASSSFISQWVKGTRPIPTEFMLKLERATNKAVTRQELRPDDYWLIWPDLKAPKRQAEAA